MLLALVCAACIVGYLLIRRARRKRIWRERILAEVQALAVRHANDDAAYAAALHQLLRRAAWRYAAEAHHVQGDAWRNVLAQVPIDAVTLDTLMTLEARMYQPHVSFDRAAVESAVYRWLQQALRLTRPAEAGHA
jgi:hypothetical protein